MRRVIPLSWEFLDLLGQRALLLADVLQLRPSSGELLRTNSARGDTPSSLRSREAMVSPSPKCNIRSGDES
jgi:hypothetical protein